MYAMAKRYGIDTVHYIGKFTNPTLEEVTAYAGKSAIGAKGEGVVLKNRNFVNQFGDSCHAKFVTQEFKEDNGVTFGGNNKSSEAYVEMKYCLKYMSLERVRKIVHKLEATDGKPELKHIPKVASMAYHDMLTEEVWDMAKEKRVVNFGTLQNLCNKRCTMIYK